ncbi:hypothetical protein N3K66_006326 [Trichothecium roseum]|uniref:Uncharacterized protein n=1 Tax=Trichothecium roseum TaxID=47278 RepID=A0ACC0UV28_9HYPO|nr:hypothetical protein N3K66_006326 [Trichothecium roseum]
MEGSKPRSRVVKRSGNACTRCRKQKIKCSGIQPCEACKKRRLQCQFDDRDQKILVTKGYIADLQQQIRAQRRGSSAGNQPDFQYDDETRDLEDTDNRFSHVLSPSLTNNDSTSSLNIGSYSDAAASTTVIGSISTTNECREAPLLSNSNHMPSSLTNPLANAPSSFMTATNGRAYYLGTSSNWSYTRRVLNLAHEFVHHIPVATDSLIFDGTAYDLPWDGSRLTECPSAAPVLPSLDHAIHLVNVIKFHCSQMFHLFEEKMFMDELHDFYSNPEPQVAKPSLFYVHLLLVLALGRALSGNSHENRPAGCELFVKAMKIMPAYHIMADDPLTSIEILCTVALYNQCLDHRSCAYNYIGQATRLAMANGMHTSMPVWLFDKERVQRSLKIWWTVYVMDREMTSLMGLPQAIQDEDVQADTPTYQGVTQRLTALRMQVKLCRSIARINREVYGSDGRLNENFLESTKNVLAGLALLANELDEIFPLTLEKSGLRGISRVSAYLHLLYHQCIVLSTRPLFLCFLKIMFESPGVDMGEIGSSSSVDNLMKLCVGSSQKMISILDCLQQQDLLEKFLPHDLESLFVSTANLIIAPIVDSKLGENSRSWLDKAYELFDEFVRSKNMVAKFRIFELKQLDNMLGGFPWDDEAPQPRPPSSTGTGGQGPQSSSRDGVHEGAHDGGGSVGGSVTGGMPMVAPPLEMSQRFPPPLSTVFDDGDWENGITAEQMMDLADSIGSSDTEWMQHTIIEHGIW